jgi:hypothetical protein
MTGKDLFKQLEQQREEYHHFIKWWRKENDFVDIELIDSFYETAKSGDQYEGFELLDLEQLWELIKKQCGERVMRMTQQGQEMVTWERLDKQGGKRTISCSFAPEFLMQIFDVETRGNYIESA